MDNDNKLFTSAIVVAQGILSLALIVGYIVFFWLAFS